MDMLRFAGQTPVAARIHRGRSLVGLVLCAMVLGTLIGLAVLASIPSEASSGSDLVDTTLQDPDRDTTTDQGRKAPLHDLAEARARARSPEVRGPNVDPQVTPPQIVKPFTPGVQMPGDLRLVLGGGKETLAPGEEFEMQVVIEDLERPLSAYTLEAVWDPRQVTVEEVQGLKGGFPAPTQVSMEIPGTASWNGLDPRPTQSGEVAVATLRGRVAQEATGAVRLFVTPRSITTQGTGRGLPGVPRAFTIPVE